VDFFKEGELDEAAFLVAGFWPGVGEVDVEGGEGGVWDMAAEPPDGFAMDHAGVGGGVAAEAVGGEFGVLFGPLDADEVVLGMSLCDGEEEGAFAGADFEFNGVVVAEDAGPGDFAGFVGEAEEHGFRLEVGAEGHGDPF
jgi:hypothetical protein